MTTREENLLLSKSKKGDKEAKEELLLSFIPFIMWVAKRYRSSETENFDDLIQEGLISGIRGINKYLRQHFRRRFPKIDAPKFSGFICQEIKWGIQGKLRPYLPDKNIVSLDKPLGGEEDFTLKDILADDTPLMSSQSIKDEEIFIIKKRKKVLDKITKELSIREQKLLKIILRTLVSKGMSNN